MSRLPSSSLLLLLLPACQFGGDDLPPPPPDSNRMAEGMAPTPFSAAQIRESCDDGRVYRFRIEQRDQVEKYQIMTFGKGDAEHASLESRATDRTGKALGDPQHANPSWVDLQSHASFPAKDCQILTDSVQGPATTHECWVYRVRGSQDGKPTETLFCFAKDMPGPPILMERRVDQELVSRMRLVETRRR